MELVACGLEGLAELEPVGVGVVESGPVVVGGELDGGAYGVVVATGARGGEPGGRVGALVGEELGQARGEVEERGELVGRRGEQPGVGRGACSFRARSG